MGIVIKDLLSLLNSFFVTRNALHFVPIFLLNKCCYEIEWGCSVGADSSFEAVLLHKFREVRLALVAPQELMPQLVLALRQVLNLLRVEPACFQVGQLTQIVGLVIWVKLKRKDRASHRVELA